MKIDPVQKPAPSSVTFGDSFPRPGEAFIRKIDFRARTGRKETVNQLDKQMFVRILNSEMELATGCTEPGAVALTAAEAGAALRKAGGTRVEAVTVRASINIIKNAKQITS